jgi:hypothetical protein
MPRHRQYLAMPRLFFRPYRAISHGHVLAIETIVDQGGLLAWKLPSIKST